MTKKLHCEAQWAKNGKMISAINYVSKYVCMSGYILMPERLQEIRINHQGIMSIWTSTKTMWLV